MKTLSETVFVRGQIAVEDVEMLANAGIKTIINNRPDGEAPGQPLSSKMKVAAEGLGLTYLYLPMASGISESLIENSVTAYADSPSPVFAFCASGTRSTVLWCFACVKELGVDKVLMAAADAGYNLEQIRNALEQYTASAK